MKAVILAAGKGERLKDITRSVPKPMIIFNNKPIIQYNIELCKKYNISEIYINTHHHSEQIRNYFGDGKNYGVKIKYSFEEELLGTSGALNNFRENLNDQPFFVIYGDQFSEFNLSLLIEKYNETTNPIGIIAFHYRKDIEHSGVAEFDNDNRIKKFIEKPKRGEAESHWVNAGIYYLSPKIFDYIPRGFSDFGKQIFPDLLSKDQKLFGICGKEEVKVFDTPEMYKKNFIG